MTYLAPQDIQFFLALSVCPTGCNLKRYLQHSIPKLVEVVNHLLTLESLQGLSTYGLGFQRGTVKFPIGFLLL